MTEAFYMKDGIFADSESNFPSDGEAENSLISPTVNARHFRNVSIPWPMDGIRIPGIHGNAGDPVIRSSQNLILLLRLFSEKHKKYELLTYVCRSRFMWR